MCGIVGIISADDKHVIDRRKFMEQALIIDTLRGEDSTGVFYSRKKAKEQVTAGYYKCVTDGYTFVQSDDYVKLSAQVGSMWFMVGHNRAATVGAVDVEGAHPFQEGDITLVHNGTLRGTFDLPKSMHQLEVDVDSHALCHNIAMVDPDAVGEEVISKINGAFTLVWHDARDQSLNIIRNEERPIHIAQSTASDTIYFASEAGQLKYLDDRLSLVLGDIVYPEAGLHLKFKEGSLKPRVQGYELRPKIRPTPYGSGYGAGYDEDWQTGYWDGTKWVTWDEEEDDYERSLPARASSAFPKPITHHQDSRVHVGGRRREIPQKSQEMLLENNLVVEDRLVFTPITKATKPWLSGNVGYSYIIGTLASTGQTGLIYHMEETATNASFGRRWLVRPVAMNGEIVICKLVKSSVTYGDEEWAGDSTSRRPTQSSIEKDNVDKLNDLILYDGPDDTLITKDEWMKETEGGCIVCERVLSLGMASQTTWYHEFPLCPACSEDDDNIDEFPTGSLDSLLF